MTWTYYYGWCDKWEPAPNPDRPNRIADICRFRQRTDHPDFPGIQNPITYAESTDRLVATFRENWICATHGTPIQIFRNSTSIRNRRTKLIDETLIWRDGRWQPRLNTLHTMWPAA